MAIDAAVEARVGVAWRATARRVFTPAITRALLVLLAVLLWYLSGRIGLLDPVFVSSPDAVISAVPVLAGVDTVTHAFAVTGTAIGLAFLLGTAAGIVAGLAIGLSKFLRDVYYGPIVFIMSTPKVIFLPIFLLVFGTDQTAVAFGTFEAFFYVTVNVVGGIGLVEERHLVVARAYRASAWHTFRDVLLPASLPGVFAGIWYGMRMAFLGVLIAELYISAGGLGQVIVQYTNQLETDKVLAMIITISIAAVVVGMGSTQLERRLSRWRGDRTVTATTLPESLPSTRRS